MIYCNKNEIFDLLFVAVGILMLLGNAVAVKSKGKCLNRYFEAYTRI
jgi:hypothetical protein